MYKIVVGRIKREMSWELKVLHSQFAGILRTYMAKSKSSKIDTYMYACIFIRTVSAAQPGAKQ